MSSTLNSPPATGARDLAIVRSEIPADQAHLRATLTHCFKTFPEVRRFIDGAAARSAHFGSEISNLSRSGRRQSKG